MTDALAEGGRAGWQTKPSDRFVLRWIKVHLSAHVTPWLVRWGWPRPWMITLCAALLGVAAGIVFALGCGWLAGCIAALGQILDGVDGQLARLTQRTSRAGAFWDSVLDRYADGALLIGMLVYQFPRSRFLPGWLFLTLGALALIGSNLVSYTSARAQSLGLDPGKPTLASKGTRTAVMILAAWGTLAWSAAPLLALVYLAIHPNLVVVARLGHALRRSGDEAT